MIKAPKGLARRGAAFWKQILGAFELGPAEQQLLLETCRALDTIEDLQTRAGEGSKVLAELRQQRLVAARLLSQLAIPESERPSTGHQARARAAARARWSRS